MCKEPVFWVYPWYLIAPINHITVLSLKVCLSTRQASHYISFPKLVYNLWVYPWYLIAPINHITVLRTYKFIFLLQYGETTRENRVFCHQKQIVRRLKKEDKTKLTVYVYN